MKIYFYDYESQFFPLIARWTVGGIGYSAVFENENQAVGYFSGKYGIYKKDYGKTFIDRRAK